ncbi:MAG: nicotinate-nucleotide adenylyltransferase [Desulfobacterales bacterium]|nr:nicotinate-nucleotide adenylyltransferase [Desulfobacterales bacterium]MDD4071571.1 nicotinate-nucleotide adenylyltransferase [Desulfobacterales bacterium]MDD4391561.1 nicotinate-nucleotide adenylyltransferase [Desulfobacterales bacterium]
MNPTDCIYETGVIHGRFQVLHNDHVAYLMAGKRLCHHLVVGITNPDPVMTRMESVDPYRSSVLSNPLSYYERCVMVQSVLREIGISPEQFSVVPFPVNFPDRYQYYVPMDAVFFLSIYDDWGRRKLAYFNSLGLKTHILRQVAPEEKGLSAKGIRSRMMTGTPWEHLVPKSVSVLMKAWDIPGRLRRLAADS